MGWLTGYAYRRKLTITGNASASANYAVPLTISNNGFPIETGSWTVNSKTYKYRIPFTIRENDGVNWNTATTYIQVAIPVDLGWLRYNRYIDDAHNGDEIEFVDEHGTTCYYWFDTTSLNNYATQDMWVKVSLDANEIKEMYLYCDPDLAATASSNFSQSSAMEYYSKRIDESENDLRYWGTTYAAGNFDTGSTPAKTCDYNEAYGYFGAGDTTITNFDDERCSGLWTTVNIPQNAKIEEAYLKVKSASNQSIRTFKSNLFGELDANPDDFDTQTCAAWAARAYTHGASISFNYQEPWVVNTEYALSPLHEIITQYVTMGTWVSGNAMSVHWWENASSNGAWRYGYSWDTAANKTTDPPLLTIMARQRAATEPTVRIGFCHTALLGHAYSPPADIRFTDDDGETLLNTKFIAENSDSDMFSFLVTVPDVTSTAEIYVYYLNPSATLSSTDSGLLFFQDFSTESINTKNPGGFSSESGSWYVKADGLYQDPFGADGCWNNQGVKFNNSRYYMFSASNWRNSVGLDIAKSIDGLNFKHLKYFPMPIPLGNQWLLNFYKENDTYYGVCEAAIEDLTSTPYLEEMKMYMFTSKDLEHFDWNGVILSYKSATSSNCGYAPFLTKFGSTYYIYYSDSGKMRVAYGTSITGPYTDNGTQTNVGGETVSVLYQDTDSKYYVYSTYIPDPETIRWMTSDSPTFTSGTSSLTNIVFDKTSYWFAGCPFGGRIFWDAEEGSYKLYFSGMRTVGYPHDSNGEGSLGYAWKTSLGAGTWRVIDKNAYWCTVDPTGTSVVSLNTLGTIQNVVVQARLKGTETSSKVELQWRAASDNSSFYYTYVNANNDAVYLGKFLSGANTIISSASLGFPCQTSVQKDIEIRNHGSSISVFVNNFPAIMSVADGSITGSGFVKIATRQEKAEIKQILVRPFITSDGITEPSFYSATGEELGVSRPGVVVFQDPGIV